jgi:hypothetical protein
MEPVILEDLVEAARRGDRARFDRLFDLWFGAVYRVTLKRVDGDEARAQTLTRRILVGCMRKALTPSSTTLPSGESTKRHSRRAAAR